MGRLPKDAGLGLKRAVAQPVAGTTVRRGAAQVSAVMSEGVLAQCDMVKVNQRQSGMKLVIRHGRKAYALNTTESDVSSTAA